MVISSSRHHHPIDQAPIMSENAAGRKSVLDHKRRWQGRRLAPKAARISDDNTHLVAGSLDSYAVAVMECELAPPVARTTREPVPNGNCGK
jgi:hypothetical protein